jgi:DNA-binding transcriptional LysR family regulator
MGLPDDMLLFAAVVREGSFTRAARQLGITKQSASERVVRLEAKLGVRLLERTTRRLRVTDAGALYAERCVAIAAQVEEANGEVQRRQSEPVGLLRVSAPVLFGRRFLAPVVSSYLTRHPRVRVEVVLTNRRVELLEEGVDVAIQVGALPDASLTARKLGEGHEYVVASPGHLASHGTPAPGALREARCVGMRPHETWRVGSARVRVEPVLVVNDLEVACEAAIAGVGLARLPALVCGEAVRDGRLRVLFGAEAAQLHPIHAVYPSRQHLPAKVRLFLDALTPLTVPLLPLPSSPRGPARARREASVSPERLGKVRR